MNSKKIGVLGGTFDPIHLGHKKLAEAALKEAALDELIIMPNNIQPFKIGKDVSSDFHRLNMVKLTFKDNEKIRISSLEIDKDDISYTYDTLKILESNEKNAKFYFILGTDSFIKLDSWYKGIDLLKEFSFICGIREGYLEYTLNLKIQEYRDKYNTETIKLITKLPLISASEIRNRVNAEVSISHLVDKEVEKYIKENNLYLKKQISDIYSDEELVEKIIEHIENEMSEKRRIHTYGVMKVAMDLAVKFHENPLKAKVSALFHDLFRDIDVELLNEYVKKYGLQKKYLDNPNLSHSKIAVIFMKEKYGIYDNDLLNAVSFHTTGRDGMSLLEKIIYIADAVEPNRSYPKVDELRETLKTNIDLACYKAIMNTIKHVDELDGELDQDTLYAKAYFEKILN